MYGFRSSTVNDCRENGSGLVGNGLRRRQLLARHGRALRHRPLLDRPDRLAGGAIEHVQVAGLAGLCDDVDAAAVVAHRRELWRGIVVDVPDVVMHRLEVPADAGRCAHRARSGCRSTGCRHDGSRRRSCTWRCRSARRRSLAPTSTDDSAQLFAPPTVARALAGHVSAPSSPVRGTVRNDHTSAPVRTSYARMSPGAETYSRLVADPRMSRCLEHAPRQSALLLDLRGIPVEPFAQIDDAVLAEGGNGLTGLRVEGAKHVRAC